MKHRKKKEEEGEVEVKRTKVRRGCAWINKQKLPYQAKAKWLYFVTVTPDTRETKFARDYDRFLKLKSQLQEYLAENG